MSPSLDKDTLTLKRGGAIVLFIVTVLAYTVQSELVGAIYGTYRKQYFLLYLAHSAMTLIFPVHLAFLYITTPEHITKHWHQLRRATNAHFYGDPLRGTWPVLPLLRQASVLAIGLAIAAGSWYVAVAWTSMTAVTALTNTNAFWAYLLSNLTLPAPERRWDRLQMIAVGLGLFGIGIISVGEYQAHTDLVSIHQSTLSKMAGGILALLGSILYAFYEVGYKQYVSLPEPNTPARRTRTPMGSFYSTAELASDDEDITSDNDDIDGDLDDGGDVIITQQVFIMHANLVTSTVGFVTIVVLWIPIVLLNDWGWETFEWPPDVMTWLMIGAIMTTGVTYNASFMILLGVLGPVIPAVGSLCTLVMVALADWLFVPEAPLTFATLLGGALIVAGFGVLAVDVIQGKAPH